jgi:CheY-like chemotaxis protein
MMINTDQVFVALVQELLEDEGYAVLTWVDGSTAYQTARAHQPALVILDLNVTNADQSLAVLDTLTLDPETTAIPVIVCSTNPHSFFEDEAWLRSHHCHVLLKPFNLSELLAIMTTALSRTGVMSRPDA